MSATAFVDLGQAARFLTTLAGGEPVTFQTFSDCDELKIKHPHRRDFDPNARILHGTLGQHHEALGRLNSRGAGVYMMINEGDGKGRTAKNVLSVRALFVDTDGAPLPIKTPLKPHLKVQSSPGKYHLYWLVSGLELADFSTLQQALAAHYSTDLAVKDLPRVMRLPGFYHRKGAPVMVQLLEAHAHPPYNPTDTFKAWPFLAQRLKDERASEAEKERQRAESTKRAAERKATSTTDTSDRARAEKLLQAHHDTVASAGSGTRHETLKRAARALGGYIAGGCLERDEVEDALLSAAQVCDLSDSEAADVIRWGLDNGAEKPLKLTDHTSPRINFLSGKPRTRRSRIYVRMRGWARG